MKYTAVIFDLFGTLIDTSSRREYERVLAEMAVVLNAPADKFTRLWFDTFNQRTTGVLKSPEGNILHACRELGITVTVEQVKRASEIRSGFTRASIVPRIDAIETLTTLKARGLKTGLLSDCSDEVPAHWENTPLAPLIDVAIFSCRVGMKKPDPRIYRIVTEQLGVKPRECLYIGDGSSNELSGAATVGMYPVLIRVSYETGPDAYRIDEEQWHGTAISSLTEVLELIE